MARYEHDQYYRVSPATPGNPWFITTMWLARYQVVTARSMKDLEEAMNLMHWVERHALPSGVLAEQVNPGRNEPLSVSPLTWSHATFITLVHDYLHRLHGLERTASGK
jgi:GH15 family glucan-1,4-alpha-glucosidase